MSRSCYCRFPTKTSVVPPEGTDLGFKAEEVECFDACVTMQLFPLWTAVNLPLVVRLDDKGASHLYRQLPRILGSERELSL